MKTPENVLKELKTSHRKYSGADHLQFHPGQLRQFFDVAAEVMAAYLRGYREAFRD